MILILVDIYRDWVVEMVEWSRDFPDDINHNWRSASHVDVELAL